MGFLGDLLNVKFDGSLSVMELSLGLLGNAVSEGNILMLRSAIQSVRDIANDLLSRYRSDTSSNSVDQHENSTSQSFVLFSLVQKIVSEKNLEWRSNGSDLHFLFNSESLRILLKLQKR